jgi:acyl-CoA synthetase (AMP-forming)/AMP-acid ligase II
MAETGTTVMLGVPTMCIALCQVAPTADAVPPVRIAHIGGSAIPIDVARRFEETFGADIHESYGLTEMSGLATTFATGRRRAGSVGKPSSATDVRIASPDERGVGEVQFPRHVAFVDELPKSPTGKILKRSIDLSPLFGDVVTSAPEASDTIRG